MLVVKLSSGLGNQLFQYAFALYLKELYQDVVYLDKSSYKYRTANRTCSIDIISDLPVLSDKRIYYHYKSVMFYMRRALFSINPFVRSIKESNLIFPSNNKFLYFDGYWQTDSFVKKIAEYAVYFKPKETIPAFVGAYLDEVHSSHSISLHVRRGDFFSDEYRHKYGVCHADYYNKAVNMLTENLSNSKIFVFSDDIGWVRKNIQLPENCIYIKNEDVNPYWYVFLMSNCRDNIISNSSFSWWGAYLNDNPQKKVVAPKEWLVGEKWTLALDGWIKI